MGVQRGWSIIVHGGAGAIPGALEAEHRAGCLAAVRAGAELLDAGADALEVACEVVRRLEDDPRFNAGRGAALDADGVPALDASVMRGSDLGYGACAAVVGVKNPVQLARAVLQEGRHVLLVGPSAVAFARAKGVPLCDPQWHVTEGTEREWRLRRDEILSGRADPTADWTPTADGTPTADSTPSADGTPSADDAGVSRGNTVGAAVRDERGELAAATSTGGILCRIPGRVGDSPIAGAGNYAAADLGAASATGHGETMLRTVFTFRALCMARDAGAEAPPGVFRRALEEARVAAGGRGGIIAVLPDGRVAHARNTRAMGVAWQRAGEAATSAF